MKWNLTKVFILFSKDYPHDFLWYDCQLIPYLGCLPFFYPLPNLPFLQRSASVTIYVQSCLVCRSTHHLNPEVSQWLQNPPQVLKIFKTPTWKKKERKISANKIMPSWQSYCRIYRLLFMWDIKIKTVETRMTERRYWAVDFTLKTNITKVINYLKSCWENRNEDGFLNHIFKLILRYKIKC